MKPRATRTMQIHGPEERLILSVVRVVGWKGVQVGEYDCNQCRRGLRDRRCNLKWQYAVLIFGEGKEDERKELRRAQKLVCWMRDVRSGGETQQRHLIGMIRSR